MSEWFWGPDTVVWTTNGGGEALYEALSKVAELHAKTDGERALARWLKATKETGIAGARAFDLLHDPTLELKTVESRRFLCWVIAEFAREVAKPQPDRSLTDIAWDRPLRLRWLQFLSDLHDLVGRTLAPKEAPPPLSVPLPAPPDATVVELHRALHELEVLAWVTVIPDLPDERRRALLPAAQQRVVRLVREVEAVGAFGAGLRERMAAVADRAEFEALLYVSSTLRMLLKPPPLDGPGGPGADRVDGT